MAPLVCELRKNPEFTSVLVATGQHGTLLDQALQPFGLVPDIWLTLENGLEPCAMGHAIDRSLAPVLANLVPTLVLVHGDTTSALAAARTAHRLRLAVGHIEAGLRSHDLTRPWPEEGNRVAIDQLSDLLFAPTALAMNNLAADPRVNGQTFLTGNTGIDALLTFAPDGSPTRMPRDTRLILVTLHRREILGDPLVAVCGSLRLLASRPDVRMELPVHPNPAVRAIIKAELEGHPRISLIEPLPYPEMIARMAKADLILSDSGGVQEEAPALGTPLLILRDVTERPEAIACGAARLTGLDPQAILAQANALLDDPLLYEAMAKPRFPFGTGNAAKKIVTAIENYLRLEKVTPAVISASGGSETLRPPFVG